jgi:hypothetical protein
MTLRIGNWYYFDILGYKSFLYVYDQTPDTYLVKHYFDKQKNKIRKDVESSYVSKGSKTIYSYVEISEKEVIQHLFE